jgi:PEP-CTERM motif
MKKPNLKLMTNTACGVLLLSSALEQTALADLSYSDSTTISSYLSPGAGLSLAYTSVAASSATTGQGQPGAAGGAAYTVLSETFTPSTSYTLGGFDILESGLNGLTMGVHLYDVTASLTSNNGTVTQGSGATYPAGLTDLFGGGAGLSFTTPGSSGTVQGMFLLSNGTTSDEVTLNAGDTYALEFWTPTSSGASQNFVWSRGGAVATDGQMMGSTSSSTARLTIASLGLAGGAPRTASLALFALPVPEPSSLSLLGLGVLGALSLRRRSA